jgi:hypothetical protein
MQKTILIFGLISGTIMAFFVFFIYWLHEQGIITMDKGELVGYTAMVVALSIVFFGIKSYRDNQGRGSIKFWKAVQIGLLISLIASVMYGGAAVLHGIIFPGWGDKHMAQYAEYQMENLRKSGATQEQLDEKRKEMDYMLSVLKNPLLFFLLAVILEIMPVGVIITFISAAILRKKEFLPATAAYI